MLSSISFAIAFPAECGRLFPKVIDSKARSITEWIWSVLKAISILVLSLIPKPERKY